MKKAASETEDITEVLERGYRAALQGVEDCKNLRSRVGRSKNFKEKTLGLPDPGAVSVSFWFQGFYSTIYEQ